MPPFRTNKDEYKTEIPKLLHRYELFVATWPQYICSHNILQLQWQKGQITDRQMNLPVLKIPLIS